MTKTFFTATQLFSFEPFRNNPESFHEKLRYTKSKMNLSALMIGANLKEDESIHVREVCHKLDIKTYLWYPVLADIPEAADIKGLELRGLGDEAASFILETQKESGEDFGFLCPVKAHDDTGLFDFYQGYLDRFGFDGVFLDKIRYPSPANGLSNLIGCQCEVCRKRYKEEGLNPVELFDRLLEKLKTLTTALEMQAVINGFLPELKAFYAFRERQVTRLVSKYIKAARDRELSVGIDLFTPSLASVVSQNYDELCRLADWVKPMLYLKTMGPAGLPMEFASLVKIVRGLNAGMPEGEIIRFFKDKLAVDLPQTLSAIEKDGLAFSVFSDEMNKAENFTPDGMTTFYPGFEAVTFPPVCDMTEERLKQYQEEIRKNELPGFVLSWDISKIPEKNIQVMEQL
jgi:hypothetical protein